MIIDLGYRPREHFVPFHMRKQRWSVLVCHRRAGKTVASVADLIDSALRSERPNPRYAYIAPTYAQAKDVAWGYLTRYTAPIPGCTPHETELRVDLPGDRRIRLYGSDNYDRMRGIGLDGAVLDEFAMMDPRAWPEVIRPALSDRQGWAVFSGTPKGRVGLFDMLKQAQAEPDDWFSAVLRASETKVLPDSELADARKMMTEDQYAQEYECSFDAAIVGAYYGKEMRIAESEGRIGKVSYDPAAKVWTAWDLGIGDTTAIWCAQFIGTEIHVIDYYEASGESLAHYVDWLESKRYVYEEDILPHDAEARELGTGKTRREVLQGLGRKVRVLPQQKVDDGIGAVRMALPRCWFDAGKCDHGLEALRQYRAHWDDKLGTLKDRPVHDWASHPADAFRYLIEGMQRRTDRKPSARPVYAGAGGWMR